MLKKVKPVYSVSVSSLLFKVLMGEKRGKLNSQFIEELEIMRFYQDEISNRDFLERMNVYKKAGYDVSEYISWYGDNLLKNSLNSSNS